MYNSGESSVKASLIAVIYKFGGVWATGIHGWLSSCWIPVLTQHSLSAMDSFIRSDESVMMDMTSFASQRLNYTLWCDSCSVLQFTQEVNGIMLINSIVNISSYHEHLKDTGCCMVMLYNACSAIYRCKRNESSLARTYYKQYVIYRISTIHYFEVFHSIHTSSRKLSSILNFKVAEAVNIQHFKLEVGY
ncbi:hypothetical protein C0J52_22425 [Blattella germanica]|nr:hypothetical protein C0J52_22425 [Blattella germanica]